MTLLCLSGVQGRGEGDMKAVMMVSDKGGRTLELREVPRPQPGPGELLIKVKTAALNRADILQLKGAYPTQSAVGHTIAGLEAAGEVTAVGANVLGFSIGDRVMAMCSASYAEYAILDHRLALRVPERLSWEEAATIPVAYMTEHDALITNAQLQPGQTVLIHAASSGVGVAGIQIAKLFGARLVFCTGSSQTKFPALKALGLDIGIDYRTENFADSVLAATNETGVDVVIDHVGGVYLKENLRCMAIKGRLVSVGRLGQAVGELDLELLAFKRLHLIGVTFRTRTIEERIAIAQRVRADILPALADGRLKPVINRIFPLEQVLEAQAYMVSNAQTGKIVLKVQ
jgi:NADPH2:quinone reductase